MNGGNGIVLDLLVKHHSYDAIGRLARTLSPYPSPAQQSGGALRSERFYYDGIRRLVEVQIDTIKSLAGALASGNQTYVNLANDALDLSDGDIDQSAAPAAYEVAYIAAASPTITTTREYIWGPGDRGIYELIMQFDAANARLWVMQDEGGDVAAACDAGGVNNQLRLVGLWSYGPCGEVIKDVSLIAHSPIHAGHKGLFVDRLDAGVAGIGGAETTRLATGATHAVFANNRHLLPKVGRWAQADPNASGLSLLTAARRGMGLRAVPDAADLTLLYTDGPSMYQYVRSEPWGNRDDLGLFAGFFVPDAGDIVMLGLGALRGAMEELTWQYGSNLLADVVWAVDWDMGDDWHTRGSDEWVARAWNRGLWKGFMSQVEDMTWSEYWLAGPSKYLDEALQFTRRRIHSVAEMAQLTVHDSIKAAKKADDRLPLDDAHHIVFQSMDGPFRQRVKPGGGPAVNIDYEWNRGGMNGVLNDALAGKPYTRNNLSTEQAQELMEEVYRDAPLLKDAALKYLNGD